MAQNIEELIATGDEEYRWLRPIKEAYDELTAFLTAETATDTAAFLKERSWFMGDLVKQLCEIMCGYYYCEGLKRDLLRILRQGFMDRDAETPTARLDWLSKIYALFRELAQGQQRVYWDETGEYLRELGFSLDDTAFRRSDAFKLSRKEKLLFMGSRKLTGMYQALLKLVRKEWDAVAEMMVPLLGRKKNVAVEMGALLQRCYAAPPLQSFFAENMSEVVRCEEFKEYTSVVVDSPEPIDIEAHPMLQLVMDYTGVYPGGIKPFKMFIWWIKICIDNELKKGRPVHVLLDYVLERAAAFFAARNESDGTWDWSLLHTCGYYCGIFDNAVSLGAERSGDLLYYMECAAEAVRIYPSELRVWGVRFEEGAWRLKSYGPYTCKISEWRYLSKALARHATAHPDQRVRASANAKMEMIIDRYDDGAWSLVELGISLDKGEDRIPRHYISVCEAKYKDWYAKQSIKNAEEGITENLLFRSIRFR